MNAQIVREKTGKCTICLVTFHAGKKYRYSNFH